MAIEILLVLGASYLLGSIPWAYILGRLRGVDVRVLGDGTVGAKNTFQQVGKIAGVAVAVLDVAKGAAAILLARGVGLSPIAVFASGAVAVLGHDFPLLLRFRGGQGYATIVGISLSLLPWETLFSIGVVALVLAFTHHWNWSNMVGFAFLPFMAWWRDQPTSLIIFVSLLLPTVGLMKLLNLVRQREILHPH